MRSYDKFVVEDIMVARLGLQEIQTGMHLKVQQLMFLLITQVIPIYFEVKSNKIQN